MNYLTSMAVQGLCDLTLSFERYKTCYSFSINRSDYASAAAVARAAIKTYPDSGEFYMQLAWAERKLKDYGAAIEHCRIAIELIHDPALCAEVHAAMGALYRKICNYKEARDHLNVAAKHFADADFVVHNRAEVTLRLGGRERALAMMNDSIKKALEADVPISAFAWNCRGRVFLDKEEWLLAINDFFRALMAKSNSFNAHKGLGRAFAELGMIHYAQMNYRRALELRPDNREVKIALENLHNIGRPSQSRLLFPKVISQS